MSGICSLTDIQIDIAKNSINTNTGIRISASLISGHLYLADHGSTDRGLMDHVDSLFQDCTTRIYAYHNEHMYLSVLYL